MFLSSYKEEVYIHLKEVDVCLLSLLLSLPPSLSLSPPLSHSHFLPILEGSSYIHESDMGDRHFLLLILDFLPTDMELWERDAIFTFSPFIAIFISRLSPMFCTKLPFPVSLSVFN